MESNIIFIYTTYPDSPSAKTIVQHLLDFNLIACANLYPGVQSLYRWKNKTEETQEVVLILKTQKQLYSACQTEILKTHPYTTPCVLELPISKGAPDYCQWIIAETTGPRDSNQ